MGKVSGSDHLESAEVMEFASAADPVLRAKVAGDEFPRVQVLADGTVLTGDGTEEPATALPSIPTSITTYTQTYSTADDTVPEATYAAPAVTAATIATADAADQTSSYVEADVDSIATLANATKVEVNKLVVDKASTNTALAALAADVIALKKVINQLIDDSQAAGTAL